MAMHYQTRISLGLSSVDRAGVLFYPELFRHAHDVYEEFMGARGLSLAELLVSAEYLLPVVHAQADYRLPMHHGSSYSVELTIGRLGATSFTVCTEFIGGDGRAHARTESVHVCVDAANGRPMALPEAMRQGLRPYEDGREVG